MKSNYLSEREIARFSVAPHGEPFADMPALISVTTLSASFIHQCITTNKLRADRPAPLRLKAHKLQAGMGLHVVFLFDEIKLWVSRWEGNVDGNIAESVAKSACYKTANRVVRGSFKRSLLSSAALHAYANRFCASQEGNGNL